MRFVAVLRIDQNQCASMLTPQRIKQKHAESNVERNRAIRSFFDPTTRGTVGSSLSRQARYQKSGWQGSESTRLGSPPKSRIRTGLPRRQICGARRMAHGQDFSGRS
jgi:hypothetical protein